MDAKVKQLLRVNSICNIVINGLLNTFFGWLLNKSTENVTFEFWVITINWVISCHIICFLTLTATNRLAKKYYQKGLCTESNKLVALPTSPLLLKLLFSEISSLFAILLFVLPPTLMGVDSLHLWGFALYKGVGGAIIGSTVANIVLRRLLIKSSS